MLMLLSIQFIKYVECQGKPSFWIQVLEANFLEDECKKLQTRLKHLLHMKWSIGATLFQVLLSALKNTTVDELAV